MKPKGTIIAIGGNEEKDFNTDERFHTDFGEGPILKNILEHVKGKDSRIEIVTTASSIPEKVGNRYLEAFRELDHTNVGLLNIRTRTDADDEEVTGRIEQTDALMFSGGDQSRLSRVFRNTKFADTIHKRFTAEDFLVAGTSAGAMVMSEEMIAGGKHHDSFRKSSLKMGKGLGLMSQIIFDTHFIQRGRFGRLAEAVALFPDKLGVGLGEDTGMIIKNGNVCQVIGSGMVIIFDGTAFSYNKSRSLKSNMPISLGNLKVHILAPLDQYYIDKKEIEVYHDPRYYYNEVSK